MIWMIAATLSLPAYAQQSTDSLTMDSLVHALPEVMVSGERPLVRAEGGQLVFDLPRLLKDRAVDNAYDALKELPGVSDQDGHLLLAGRPVTIIIDGKVTTMTAEQLDALLKTIPASRLRQAEVMYAAPARYQVHGQLINLRLQHSLDELLHGEVMLKPVVHHELNMTERASLLWQQQRWSVDAFYQLTHGRSYYRMNDVSQHTLADGSVQDIDVVQQTRARGCAHNYRVAADWQPVGAHRLGLTYTGSYTPADNDLDISGDVCSQSAYEGHRLMHNLRLDYETPFHLKAAIDYTYYESPMMQRLESMLPTGQLSYVTRNEQTINRWKVHLSQEQRLRREWSINYGGRLTSTLDRSSQHYTGGTSLPDDMEARHRETIASLFAGTSKNWGQRLSLDLSLSLERYDNGTLREWVPFPSFTLQWRPADIHLLQLSLSSDRTYPEYWAVQQAVSYSMGGYGEIIGNPLLMPSKSWQLQGLWMLHSKYQLVAWFEQTDDYFVQTNYQLPDRLVMQYRHLNFDFQQQAGLMLYVPLSFFKGHTSNLSMMGIWQREKDSDFYDIPFDRSQLYTMLSVNNTVRLSPHFSLLLNGSYRTKAIQGIFDLPASGNLSAALAYKGMGDHLTIKLYGNDLLQTNGISPEMHYLTQHFRMHISYWREMGLSLKYNFGSYQQKSREPVDTSRFRQ